MRTSLITRPVIAVAALAIGSAALVAAPADAATASGVTRDQILTAAAGVRAAPPGTTAGLLGGGGAGFGPAANRALKAMVNRVCLTDPEGPEIYVAAIAAAVAPGSSADGLVVSAYLLNAESSSGSSTGRVCSFGALAPTAERSVLAGTASLTGAPTTALSGDAFVTPPVSAIFTSGPTPIAPTFSASGSAIQSTTVKIKDKKTSKEKKAAKKKYVKRLAAAKKAYTKALKKAGSSSKKKSAAKNAYKAKVKSAKATYRYAIANYQLKTVKTATPFAVSAQSTFAP